MLVNCVYMYSTLFNSSPSGESKTTNFFQSSRADAEIQIRDIYYDKMPCDITSTPFNPVVSESFKLLSESFKINVSFHKVNVFVAGEILDLNHYYAEPLDSIDFIDRSSPKVVIRPDDDTLGFPGWINHDLHKTRIYYSRVESKHWIKQPKAFGYQWIVSNEFRAEIEKQKLTNFNFFPAHGTE